MGGVGGGGGGGSVGGKSVGRFVGWLVSWLQCNVVVGSYVQLKPRPARDKKNAKDLSAVSEIVLTTGVPPTQTRGATQRTHFNDKAFGVVRRGVP